MYGYQSPEHLIESLVDISSQLYAEPEQREALMELAAQFLHLSISYRGHGKLLSPEFAVNVENCRAVWTCAKLQLERSKCCRPRKDAPQGL